MASLVVSDRSLVVRLTATERILGLVRRDPEAPLEAIRSVGVASPARSAIRGIRAPGTGLPGVTAIGHWRGPGRHDFVAVYGNHDGVVVELEGAPYTRFVVSVDHAKKIARGIERARRDAGAA